MEYFGMNVIANPLVQPRRPLNPELSIKSSFKWITPEVRQRINDALMDEYGWERNIMLVNLPDGKRAVIVHPSVERKLKEEFEKFAYPKSPWGTGYSYNCSGMTLPPF